METRDSGERGMNPVAMTVINPCKEYWLSQGLNQPPPVLKPATLQIERWGLAVQEEKHCRKGAIACYGLIKK